MSSALISTLPTTTPPSTWVPPHILERLSPARKITRPPSPERRVQAKLRRQKVYQRKIERMQKKHAQAVENRNILQQQREQSLESKMKKINHAANRRQAQVSDRVAAHAAHNERRKLVKDRIERERQSYIESRRHQLDIKLNKAEARRLARISIVSESAGHHVATVIDIARAQRERIEKERQERLAIHQNLIARRAALRKAILSNKVSRSVERMSTIKRRRQDVADEIDRRCTRLRQLSDNRHNAAKKRRCDAIDKRAGKAAAHVAKVFEAKENVKIKNDAVQRERAQLLINKLARAAAQRESYSRKRAEASAKREAAILKVIARAKAIKTQMQEG